MSVQVLVKSKSVGPDFLVRVEGVPEAIFDEITNEDTPYELMDNVMIMHSPATFEHQALEAFILRLLAEYVERLDLGVVVAANAILRLQSGRKVAPDVMFLSTVRNPTIGDQVQGTADLVIEILSPSTRVYDLGEKRQAYRDARTPEIWFVDPKQRRIFVDVRSGRSYKTRSIGSGRLRSTVLPGFYLEAAWLWRRPLPRPMDCLREIMGG